MSLRTEEPSAAGAGGNRVGARLERARAGHGLSVEELSSRTYIRASVLRRMEEDDFTACGGDCYARGQLRMLARVLQVDEDELVAAFDQQLSSSEPDDLVADGETATPADRRRGGWVTAGVWLGLLMLAVLAGLLIARVVP